MKKGCYAVIFSNQMKAIDDVFYQQLSKSLRKLAQDQKGYLGLESYRNEDGAGVTISYWETKEAIVVWKKIASIWSLSIMVEKKPMITIAFRSVK